MTKNIFTRKKSDVRAAGQSSPASFFLATVASVSGPEGLTIIPDGQTEAVPKKYKMLVSGAAPNVGDRVVVMRHSGTCVILGAIGYPDDIPDGGDKVDRAGDTMTGELDMADADIALTSSAITLGTKPASNQFTNKFRFRDAVRKTMARIQAVYLTSGQSGIQIYADNYADGEDVYNYLGMYMGETGIATVAMSHPAAWRWALGLGTNGALPITVAQGGTGAATAAAHSVFAGPAGSSAGAPSFRALSMDDITAGTLAVARGGTGAATAAAHSVFAGPAGSSAGAPSFRALSAADITAGTLPIARGGTGQTSVSWVTSWANIATAASGVTGSNATFCQWGKLGMLFLSGSVTTAKTTGNVLATLLAGLRPAIAAPAQAWLSTNLAAVIQANGEIILGGSLSAGTAFTIIACYLLA